MSDIVSLFESSLGGFGRRVHAIREDRWANPTPCTDWDVRALVHHLVYEIVWIPPIFAGETIEGVGDRFEGDLLGEDPVGAWDAAAPPAIAAVSGPGAMRRIVHLSFGDVPGEEYAWQLTLDLAIHGWDLARGIGADDTMDPGLVAELLPYAGRWAKAYRSSGAFADEVAVGDDADPQTRLLAITGRRR